jgi:hypothetical protein
MHTTSESYLSQRWTRWMQIQTHLLPTLCAEFNSTSPKLEKLIHILEWILIGRNLQLLVDQNHPVAVLETE